MSTSILPALALTPSHKCMKQLVQPVLQLDILYMLDLEKVAKFVATVVLALAIA